MSAFRRLDFKGCLPIACNPVQLFRCELFFRRLLYFGENLFGNCWTCSGCCGLQLFDVGLDIQILVLVAGGLELPGSFQWKEIHGYKCKQAATPVDKKLIEEAGRHDEKLIGEAEKRDEQLIGEAERRDEKLIRVAESGDKYLIGELVDECLFGKPS